MPKQPIQKSNQQKEDSYLDETFDICNAASTGDCTGLIFAAPQSDEEWDSYDDVYHFQPVSLTKEKE